MKPSISFDRAAGFYDSTREFPEEAAEAGIRAILDVAGARALILDVGTGTGRISVPLLRHGANLLGCDISRKMMAVLRSKMPEARLTRADASSLPFPAGHFDAVTTCHVMHLVGPWREALKEYRRVLKAGGAYIDVQTEREHGPSAGRRIKEFWHNKVREYGASPDRPGVEDDADMRAELLEMGATTEHIEVARYKRSHSVQETVDHIALRTHSSSWVVPDAIFERSVRDLREWVAKEFNDPNVTFEEESTLSLDVARFGDSQ